MPLIKNKRQKGRFALVGVANTVIDFAILFVLHGLGLASVVANLISTSSAFIFSFVANRRYTFEARSGDVKRQFTLFFVVTLSGLLILQPLIILLVEPASAQLLPRTAPWLHLLIAKLAATAATLVLNYILYERVVFKKPEPSSA